MITGALALPVVLNHEDTELLLQLHFQALAPENSRRDRLSIRSRYVFIIIESAKGALSNQGTRKFISTKPRRYQKQLRAASLKLDLSELAQIRSASSAARQCNVATIDVLPSL